MSEEVKQGAGMFGITTETKSANNVPLLTPTKLDSADAEFPSGWKFPTARLVNVVSNPEFEKKDGGKVPILSFTFADSDRRQHTHIEWEVDMSDAKAKEKIDWMNSRIKHIYEAVFGTFPEKGIGTNAQNFTEFFNAVAAAFNTPVIKVKRGDEDKTVKVYTQVNLYYKLTFYKGNLRFPLAPNFLEKNEPSKPCKTLSIDPRYDQTESDGKSNKGSGIPGIGGSSAGSGGTDDLPSFEEAYT